MIFTWTLPFRGPRRRGPPLTKTVTKQPWQRQNIVLINISLHNATRETHTRRGRQHSTNMAHTHTHTTGPTTGTTAHATTIIPSPRGSSQGPRHRIRRVAPSDSNITTSRAEHYVIHPGWSPRLGKEGKCRCPGRCSDSQGGPHRENWRECGN